MAAIMMAGKWGGYPSGASEGLSRKCIGATCRLFGVPAIAPDTSGARSMREQMTEHAHPIVTVLDVIKKLILWVLSWRHLIRWVVGENIVKHTEDASQTFERKFYANQGRVTTWATIRASATLADGTVVDMRRSKRAYLLGHMDLLTHCLIEKLMVTALGRKLSFKDRRVLQQLAAEAIQSQYGLQDVILAVILSDHSRHADGTTL